MTAIDRIFQISCFVACVGVVAGCDAEPRDAEELDDGALEDESPRPAANEVGLTARTDPAGYVVEAWISDETPPASCGANQIASGFLCQGSNCDNVTLECGDYGASSGRSYWTNLISEEAPYNWYVCDEQDGYITGIRCLGGKCDNISVECTKTGRPRNFCEWTDWYSEEQGWFWTYGSEAIAGIQCRGGSCDDMSYLVCRTD